MFVCCSNIEKVLVGFKMHHTDQRGKFGVNTHTVLCEGYND